MNTKLTFSETHNICPLCHSKRFKFIYTAKYRDMSTYYDICSDCHSIFQNPPLSKETLAAIYNSSTYWDTTKTNKYIYTGYIEQEKQYVYEANRRFALMSKCLPDKPIKRMKVLEIGCGPGFTAKPFLKAGADVTGIDPSREMAKYAKEKIGLNVLTGMFEDLELVSCSYDVIFTWGTSMNFSNPHLIYKKTLSMLEDRGSLFFDFFDMNGLFSFLTYRKRKKAVHASCAPSKKGIKAILTRAGFNEVKFYRYFPYYSLSFIASQLDILPLKKLFNISPFNVRGIIVPFPGSYIVHAVK